MSKKKCHECGGELTRRTREILTAVGPFKVRDGSGMGPGCDKCDTSDMSLADARGYELRAARMVLTAVPEIPGSVMKFARKAMGLRQEDLGGLLDLDRATVCRLETDAQTIAKTTQLALLALVDLALLGPEKLDEQKNQQPVAQGAEFRPTG
jgi:DNA-binding XRE family transcriptional regulator